MFVAKYTAAPGGLASLCVAQRWIVLVAAVSLVHGQSLRVVVCRQDHEDGSEFSFVLALNNETE